MHASLAAVHTASAASAAGNRSAVIGMNAVVSGCKLITAIGNADAAV